MPPSNQLFRTDEFLADVGQQRNAAVERGAQNLGAGVQQGLGLVQQFQQIQSNQLRLARDEIALREFEERVAAYDKELAIRERVAQVSMAEMQVRGANFDLNQKLGQQQEESARRGPFVRNGKVFRSTPTGDGGSTTEELDIKSPAAQSALMKHQAEQQRGPAEVDLLKARAERERRPPFGSNPSTKIGVIRREIEAFEEKRKQHHNLRQDEEGFKELEMPQHLKDAQKSVPGLFRQMVKGGDFISQFDDPGKGDDEVQAALERVFDKKRRGKDRIEDDFTAVILSVLEQANESGQGEQVMDRLDQMIESGVEQVMAANPQMSTDDAVETVLRRVADRLRAGGIVNRGRDIFEKGQ